MIAILLAAVLHAGAAPPIDCEIDACSAAELRALWLAERDLRIGWEAQSQGDHLRLAAATSQVEGLEKLLALERTARLSVAPPPPAEPTSCIAIAVGACGLCGGAGVGVAAMMTR